MTQFMTPEQKRTERGRNNVTQLRMLAQRRAALAKALRQPLRRGEAVTRLKQRKELAEIDSKLTALKNGNRAWQTR